MEMEHSFTDHNIEEYAAKMQVRSERMGSKESVREIEDKDFLGGIYKCIIFLGY